MTMNPAVAPAVVHTVMKNPRYPSKTSKYAGVTFRSSREKYQARIYKGNKEYNLGLFDLAADAALAYDIAHRLVKRVQCDGHGKEKEALAAYESDANAPHWLDYGEEDDANKGLDPDKLNFLTPGEYMHERKRELQECTSNGTPKSENAPKIEEVRNVTRKESIRVVKIIIGASDGGTNNYRRKGKKGGRMQDGTLANGKKKRRRKSQESTASDIMAENGLKPLPMAMDPLMMHPAMDPMMMHHHNGMVHHPAAWGTMQEDAYYLATGLGRPVPNPARSMNEHPYGAPPVVPMGAASRANQDMIRHMGKSTMKAMMEDNTAAAAAFNGVGNHLSNGDIKVKDEPKDEKKSPAGGGVGGVTDNNSTFSGDTHQAGNLSAKPPSSAAAADFNSTEMKLSYYGMGVAPASAPGSSAAAVTAGNNPAEDVMQSPENYREWFKNMRNVFPSHGMVGMPTMAAPAAGAAQMYGSTSEEIQRSMMLARAGMQHTGGMAGMTGMEGATGLGQENLYATAGFGDQAKKDSKDLESLKSMVQNGHHHAGATGADPRQPTEGAGNTAGLQSISPTTLNAYRASGYASASAPAGSQNPYAAHGAASATAMREQQLLEAGMYGTGDRYGQYTLGAAQYGLAAQPGYGQYGALAGAADAGAAGAGSAAAAAAADQAYLQGYGQTGYPSAAGPVAASAQYNPAFDDMAQLLGMSGSQPSSGRVQAANGSADTGWTA